MKRTLMLSSIVTTCLLISSGCSGGASPVETSEVPPVDTQTNAADTIPTCQRSGDTVLVPEGESCTYSIPSLNNGEEQTYTCENGTLSGGGITAGGGTIVLSGITITCE